MLAGGDVKNRIAAHSFQRFADERLPQLAVASGSLYSISLDIPSADFLVDFLSYSICAFCCPQVLRIIPGTDPGRVTGKATGSLPLAQGSRLSCKVLSLSSRDVIAQR